jgi:predicted acyltransferase
VSTRQDEPQTLPDDEHLPTAQALADAAPPTSRARIASLDAARGLMLVWSVTSVSLIAAPKWYEHAPWAGVHPVDLVFPVFVTLSGCGLAFANRRRTPVGPLVRRIVVLLAFGLLYNTVVAMSAKGGSPWPGWAHLRLTGVLQLYAGVVLVIALGHLVTRSARGWAVLTLLLAVAHTAVLWRYAQGCPGESLTRECNPSGALDPWLFGIDHVYATGLLGHDPEGVLSVLGACVSAAAGATVGHALLSARDRGRRPVGALLPVATAAVGFACLSVLTGLYVPTMKRLWTAPFALSVAAAVAVVLVLLHLLLDRPSARVPPAAATPLVALGRNSLLVYFGSHALIIWMLHDRAGTGSTWLQTVSDAVTVKDHTQLSWTVLNVVAWTALATVLHRFRIYLRP